jgi:hypothetical protein
VAQLELIISSRLRPDQSLYLGPDDGVEGQLRLPREPPFSAVIGIAPAALVTVDLAPDSERLYRSVNLFNAWYQTKGVMSVIAGDGKATWISGEMRCVEMEVHEGIQTTVAVPPPIMWAEREVLIDGVRKTMRLPYRAQPTFQWITRDVHRYVLAADVYEFVGTPVRPTVVREAPGVMGVMVH